MDKTKKMIYDSRIIVNSVSTWLGPMLSSLSKGQGLFWVKTRQVTNTRPNYLPPVLNMIQILHR